MSEKVLSGEERSPAEKAAALLSEPGRKIYMVGIKGTGMTALAEILHSRGLIVSGSDVEEEFYTDSILKSVGIPFYSGFSTGNIEDFCAAFGEIDLVVNSAAYDLKRHPELVKAAALGIPMMEYTEALGELSRGVVSGAVSGVHGKTTTTAIAGALVKALGLPGTVLAGSGVSGFGNRSTLIQGGDFLVAETCEYRRHFLRFHPDHLLLTSIEPDHLDYFKDFDDIFAAFISFIERLPEGGRLIYCADEPGAAKAAGEAGRIRPDLSLVPYGFQADGAYRITERRQLPGRNCFTLAGWKGEFELQVPGLHTVLDAAGALALVVGMAGGTGGTRGSEMEDKLKEGISSFAGSRRRSEILGEAGGILFMDDYAHHPSALKTTLKGLKEFYPDRRLVVDFMSHTYSRTAGLFDEFCSSFGDADRLILHKIYGSARESAAVAEGIFVAGPDGKKVRVSGESLYEGVCRNLAEKQGKTDSGKVMYYHEIMDAESFLAETLRPGDLFITMGAGNNWTLGRELYNQFAGEEK